MLLDTLLGRYPDLHDQIAPLQALYRADPRPTVAAIGDYNTSCKQEWPTASAGSIPPGSMPTRAARMIWPASRRWRRPIIC